MGIGLYDYQLDAINKMHNGCILCGGVGSGKSRTALGYYFKENGGGIIGDYKPMVNPKDLYIITTAKKRDTKEWESDMAPFLLTTNEENKTYHHNLIIDSWNNISKYKKVKDSFFIFDEQRVVGKGAWVKSFITISKNNQWILLSATPGDKWEDYVPVFIANGFIRSRTEFELNHVVYNPYKKFPQVLRYLDTGSLIHYRNKILVDMDFKRTTKSHHEDVYCTYDIPLYNSLNSNRWNPYDNKPIENASEYCNLQRKVVNSSEDRQVKLLEICEKHDRVIIFYTFDYELEILRGMHYGDDVEVAEWNGHNHQPIPNSNKWIYLVQYASGCEGWNCIKTDTIIFYSQTYSYRTLEQATGRIDRLDTPYKDLYYYHLKSKSSIDRAISSTLANKKTFNESRYVGSMFKPKNGLKFAQMKLDI